MTKADLGTKSMPRNPLLFGMLYRMGVVENIGSGIRRTRELCREHGVAEPAIKVSEHWVTVTFSRPAQQVETVQSADGSVVRDRVADYIQDIPGGRPESNRESKTGTRLEPRPESTQERPEWRPESEAKLRAEARPDSGSASASRPELESVQGRVLALLGRGSLSRSAISKALGHRSVSGGLKKAIHSLMAGGLIEYSIPETPNSRLQKYLLTERGRTRLGQTRTGHDDF